MSGIKLFPSYPVDRTCAFFLDFYADGDRNERVALSLRLTREIDDRKIKRVEIFEAIATQLSV